ncbi:MAG: trimeric autotransporter adhesin, partial [Bacteroidota bacterium]|nr:trimeric autotransporter adhesin [Bacteroidota bacterium]
YDIKVARVGGGSYVISQEPSNTFTIQAPWVETGNPTAASYCAGSSVYVPFTNSDCFYSSRTITVYLSDAQGSFNNPTIIGYSYQPNSTINAVLPINIQSGTDYRVRVDGRGYNEWYQNYTVTQGNVSSSFSITGQTITTGTVTGSPFLLGSTNVAVPFTVCGGFNQNNTFSAQLSNEYGSFASPTVIGTWNGTENGTVYVTIPNDANSGTGYRIRVVSDNPAIIGTDNGTNLEITSAPLIVTLSDVNTCRGINVQLGPPTIENGTGPYTYSWSPTTGLNNSTIANPTVSNPLTSRYYTLSVTDNGRGGAYDDAIMYMRVLLPPTVTLPSYVSIRRSVGIILNDQISNYNADNTYNWTLQNGTPVSGTTRLYPQSSTRYYVRATDQNGCISSSYSIYVFVTSGKETFDGGSAFVTAGGSFVSANPNPVDNVLNIQAAFSTKSDVDIKIVSQIGQTVVRMQRLSTDIIEEQVDMSNLPAGMYLLILQSGEEIMSVKLVKE